MSKKLKGLAVLGAAAAVAAHFAINSGNDDEGSVFPAAENAVNQQIACAKAKGQGLEQRRAVLTAADRNCP